MSKLNISNIKLGGSTQQVKNFFTSGSAVSKVVIAIIFIVVVLVIVQVIKAIFGGIHNYRYNRIWIENGKTLCPKTSVVVPGHLLHRSKNELGGAEFTYSFWMLVSDWSFKYGQWKHILHKGNSTSWPNRAPGIWLHPKENTMRFYMNTFDSVADNYIDIQNIPLNKWFHIVYSVNQLSMDVYINGTLRKSLKFSSLPKQNNGDLYIMNFRGFEGYLSRMAYFNYAIPYSDIEKLIVLGPSPISCSGSGNTPPYLTPTWWTDTYQSGAPQ